MHLRDSSEERDDDVDPKHINPEVDEEEAKKKIEKRADLLALTLQTIINLR